MVDVATVIAERCPDLALASVAPLGEGDFCSAFLVDDRWVFRFAKHDEARASLGREACLLPRLVDRFELRVPIPEVVSLDTPPAFVAHRLVPGAALSAAGYLALGEADRDACAGQLAAFLAQLHAVDVGLAPACGLPVLDRAARCAGALAAVREHAAAHLGPTDLAFIERRLARRPPTGPSAVLHGDLSPDHVLHDPATRRATGIIDFGDLMVGDPAWDFVYLYEDYGLDLLGRTVRAYEPVDAKALLSRVHDLHVLNLVEWVADCARDQGAELHDALAALAALRRDEDDELDRLLRAAPR